MVITALMAIRATIAMRVGRMAKFVVCLALAICWACCCPAQTESLLIGPGDLLSVQVLEAPELAQHARVTDAGCPGGRALLAESSRERHRRSIRDPECDGSWTGCSSWSFSNRNSPLSPGRPRIEWGSYRTGGQESHD